MVKPRQPATCNLQSREAKLLAQGAEAKIFLEKNIIHKERVPKSYRHPQLDNQIRTRRTRAEAKILTKAIEAKINVPKIITTEKFTLNMEFIEGDKLSETLNSYEEKKQSQVMKKLGKQTALLHKNNIIHGDLTTSNTILQNPCNLQPATCNLQSKIYIIDFGLSYISTKLEDKAVDLHLIKQALEAKHFRSPDHPLGQNHEDLFKHFIKGYKWEESKKILERLELVEKRGRYKR